MLENFRDGCAGAGFDNVVGVEEGEMESGSDVPADGGFTRPHKANQRKIADVTGSVHKDVLQERGRNGTP
jgi:hypothetical protein